MRLADRVSINLEAPNSTRLQRLAPGKLFYDEPLQRDYGFDAEELPFNLDGSLPLGMDPKLAWAKEHLDQNPVEVNLASKSQLLRIPGIGPKTAQAILQARRQQTLRDLSGLHRLGINAARAAPFILLNGKRSARQLALF
jgi:predicted DNA-binding helix-hairpin-helix protein